MRTTLSEIREREVIPGFHARFVHTVRMTEAYWRIEAGAAIETHSHPHEQIVNMQEGSFELTVGDAVHHLAPGDVVVIPSDVPHSGVATTDCRILDVWSPARDDYR